MMKKYQKILITIISIILLLWLGLFTVSHSVYHRSTMATVVEVYFRVIGTKNKFQYEKDVKDYIESKRNAKKFELPNIKFNSTIDSFSINKNTIFKLNNNDNKVIILYLHGGAYINEASSFQLKFIDKVANKLDAEAYIPIYPLAPNHTYEETYDLLNELYSKLLDEDKDIIIMGDSAGGGLALAFTEYLKENSVTLPDKLVLLSPWVDVSMENEDIKNYEKSDPMLSSYGLIEYGRLWAGDTDLKDYKISPIYGDLKALPDTLLFVGTREIFYPDVVLLNDKLNENNTKSKLIIGTGMNHVYPVYPISEANDAINEIVNFIK